MTDEEKINSLRRRTLAETMRLMRLQVGKLVRLSEALYKATSTLDGLQELNDFLLDNGAGYDDYTDLDVDVEYFYRILPFISKQFVEPYAFASVDETEYKRSDDD